MLLHWLFKRSTMNDKELTMKSGKNALIERFLKSIDCFDLTVWINHDNDRDF